MASIFQVRKFLRVRTKQFVRKVNKNTRTIKRVGTFGAVGAVSGGLGGGITVSAEARSAGRKEGAIFGAIAGATIAATPKIGRVIFRRIRGRIIPIRVKK